jgi:putative PEP-CTERM system histidine kinase
MTPNVVGTASYGMCTLLFLVLVLLCVVPRRNRAHDMNMVYLAIVTAVWAFANAIMFYLDSLFFLGWMHWIESIRNYIWLVVLLALVSQVQKDALIVLRRWVWGLRFTVYLQFVIAMSSVFVIHPYLVSGFYFSGLIFSVAMLVLVEQLLRNASQAQRWQTKFFGLSCVLIFGFDFLLYSQSVLKGQLQPAWLEARGAVTMLAAPLLILYVVRMVKVSRLVGLSHKLVFHTSVLLIASGYLILMSLAGYYFRVFGGGWGEFLRIVVVAGGLLGLSLFLFSGSARAKLWVILSRHLLAFQYDYREEWLKVTRALSEATELWPLTKKIVDLLSECVQSTGGAIWVRNSAGRLTLISHGAFEFPEVHPSGALFGLEEYWRDSDRIIVMSDLGKDEQLASRLSLPVWIAEAPDAWLLIPLKAQNTLQGFVLLAVARTKLSLNWENFDYIKVVASQAAVQLAVACASDQLATTQRFEAVHQLSAFFVHDMKTMVSQLSMMTKNAHRHLENPEFIKDMLGTVEHAVGKMQRIITHLKSAEADQSVERVDVLALLNSLMEKLQAEPRPCLQSELASAWVLAEPTALSAALMNLIVNAQEAVRTCGEQPASLPADEAPVMISLVAYDGVKQTQAPRFLVKIADKGPGMSTTFVQEKLFKPFNSTKGLTGMGIGLYQTKANIEGAGGEVFVESVEGEGTAFYVLLPAAQEEGG